MTSILPQLPTPPSRKKFPGLRLALVEAGSLTRLATPLVFASLASMGISITDVVMMGWLGPEHLAAGAVTSDAYSIVFYLAAGVLAAVAPLASQALGSGREAEAKEAVHQGLWAAAILAMPGAALVWNAPRLLSGLGVADEVVELAMPYARWMAVAFVAMTGVALMRQTLASFGRPRVFFAVTLLTLPINALGNWILMFGEGRFRGWGLAGAGASSAIASTFMLVALLSTLRWGRALRGHGLLRGSIAPRIPLLRELFTLGMPIGIASLGETGVFLFSTLLAGVLGTEALAAHAVSLRMAGLLYAVPLGLSQAATVRVALAAGAGRKDRVRRSSRTALGLVSGWGAAACLLLVLFREEVAALFLRGGDPAAATLGLAGTLLLVLAILHPVDDLATVAAGCLRGIKDTRVPMVLSLAGYWGVGFVLAVGLAFPGGRGALGLWLGLAAGSASVALALLLRYRRLERRSAATARIRVVERAAAQPERRAAA
ncbi:MAG TPA: MATE family efflux transporter [Thermoanaerobaculia bacterium]|nr:MATE family efflux transporter [Thermoanaerobaculia bacterium]